MEKEALRLPAAGKASAEYMLQMRRFDSLSGVSYADKDSAALFKRFDGYVAAFWRVLDSIREELRYDIAAPLLVCEHFEVLFSKLEGYLFLRKEHGVLF